jgi:hypothetical protein
MKRKALLIGNSNGLGGVKIDIANYINFLISDYGGRWYSYEIIVEMNPTKKELLATIDNLKNEKPDFAFVVFSGHGAYLRNTILEINKEKEYIRETDLIGIAKRQISIFDCCRETITEKLEKSIRSFSTEAFIGDSQNIRTKYDLRIMQSIEQQNFLYACSIDECALDSTDIGGLYTKNLIGSAKSQSINLYKLVGEVHEDAAIKTKQSAWINNLHRQNPSATLPKCFSSQQLIFSINPNLNVL